MNEPSRESRVARWALLLVLAVVLAACDAAPRRVEAEPFTWEQVDRIDARIRPDSVAAQSDPVEGDRALWVSTALRDEQTRMVVHVRLGVPGDLANVARHEARCARVRDRMQEHLLPGQHVELYIVFDESIHPCEEA